MNAHSDLRPRPHLEVLEDRAAPASITTASLSQRTAIVVVNDLLSQAALSQTSLRSSTPPTVALGAVPPPQNEGVSGPVVTTSAVGVLPVFSPNLNTLGFPGRIQFPGTGVQART